MASSYLTPTNTDPSFPRIAPLAWELDIWISLVVALTVVGLRTYFRIITFHRLSVDDFFLLFSVLCFLGSVVCAWLLRRNVYLQTDALIGAIPFEPDDIPLYLLGDKLYLAASTLIWASLFAVKFSFMFFFKPLVRRVRVVEYYWLAVMAILIPSALINIFFGFFMCTDFSINFLAVCPAITFEAREKTYLYLTTVLDILTDILVVSVPVTLLWNVNMTLQRKIGLCVVLGLSTIMVVFALIRVTLSQIGDGVTDSVWLFFWAETECCVAIIMVSITAFRQLFGLELSRNGKRRKQYAAAPWSLESHKRRTAVEDDFYEGLPDVPERLATGMRTLIRSSRWDPAESAPIGLSSAPKHDGILITNTHETVHDKDERKASQQDAQWLV